MNQKWPYNMQDHASSMNPMKLPPADVTSRMHEPLTSASVEVFLRASSSLLPTPSRSHYLFSMRDVGKALQVNTTPWVCCRWRNLFSHLSVAVVVLGFNAGCFVAGHAGHSL